MPRGRNQMYYPPCPGSEPHPHMTRPPFFPDDKMNCGMAMGEFKPPMVTQPEPPPPKKKRRTSNNNSANLANHQQPPVMQDLLPPPLTGYGDTIVASNPFDDTPPSQQRPRHMGCGPPMMMGGPPSCTMGGSPMSCGPPMSPMGMCGPPPMISSPIGQNRSPMCGPPMMCGGPPPGSPMQHRSSPLLNMDCMAQSRKGSPMMGHPINCVSPMDSPIANGPMCGSMSSPIMDIRPMNSPMCMNNGAPNNMQQCNMQSDVCKSGNVNTNGPARQQNTMVNHHPPPAGHQPHGINMHPGGMHPMSMQHPPHGYPPPKPMPVSAGKVYPVDQPMVFNPQNPNAPPIYPCGVCHKEVHDNDQAILCESGCNFWFHRVCTGLTDTAYQLLTQEVYAEWVCDKCLSTKNIPLVKFKP
ncbi:hypothetical protein AAG570_006315 [Ranatra chinensis]|uniref:PHD-type domain-containing protein n=1 Tax=Ranatra chinensis TaxID=642074 RepID=A0ABD0YTL2_9HEMI